MSSIVAGALALAQSTAIGAVKAEVKKRVAAYVIVT